MDLFIHSDDDQALLDFHFSLLSILCENNNHEQRRNGELHEKLQSPSVFVLLLTQQLLRASFMTVQTSCVQNNQPTRSRDGPVSETPLPFNSSGEKRGERPSRQCTILARDGQRGRGGGRREREAGEDP